MGRHSLCPPTDRSPVSAATRTPWESTPFGKALRPGLIHHRWILSSHPLPPLLLLPPVSLTLTLSSSLLAFLIITYIMRTRKAPSSGPKTAGHGQPMSEEALLAEKTKRTFAERDRAERQEERRRREEWEQVENSALGGGLRKMPAGRKRSAIGESTIGGVSSYLDILFFALYRLILL